MNSLRISAPRDLSVKGEKGSVKGETKSARESVSSSPIVRIFGKGKCKFIANFSAQMVTSLPSLSLSLSLSLYLSLSPKVPHAQYTGSASALPIIGVSERVFLENTGLIIPSPY